MLVCYRHSGRKYGPVVGAGMQQIAEWLGPSEYVERFVENKIDVSVLPLLTDEDLVGIGIPLGCIQRLRLD